MVTQAKQKSIAKNTKGSAQKQAGKGAEQQPRRPSWKVITIGALGFVSLVLFWYIWYITYKDSCSYLVA